MERRPTVGGPGIGCAARKAASCGSGRAEAESGRMRASSGKSAGRGSGRMAATMSRNAPSQKEGSGTGLLRGKGGPSFTHIGKGFAPLSTNGLNCHSHARRNGRGGRVSPGSDGTCEDGRSIVPVKLTGGSDTIAMLTRVV